jgi:hypothetical protein
MEALTVEGKGDIFIHLLIDLVDVPSFLAT